MKSILLLAICLSAHAAPLPPLPVVRPKPLLSPKHASAPKVSPMVKTFTTASVSMYPVLCTVKKDFNFFGCNTNDSSCVLYDITNVEGIARAGRAVRIEFSDDLLASDWALMAWYGAGPVERVVGFEWYLPVDQRPPCRYFRLVDATTTTTDFAPASGAIQINPNVNGLRTWTRPRK